MPECDICGDPTEVIYWVHTEDGDGYVCFPCLLDIWYQLEWYRVVN